MAWGAFFKKDRPRSSQEEVLLLAERKRESPPKIKSALSLQNNGASPLTAARLPPPFSLCPGRAWGSGQSCSTSRAGVSAGTSLPPETSGPVATCGSSPASFPLSGQGCPAWACAARGAAGGPTIVPQAGCASQTTTSVATQGVTRGPWPGSCSVTTTLKFSPILNNSEQDCSGFPSAPSWPRPPAGCQRPVALHRPPNGPQPGPGSASQGLGGCQGAPSSGAGAAPRL